MPLQIDQDRAKGSAPLKGEVINPQPRDRCAGSRRQSHHPAQDRHPGRGDTQPSSQTSAEPAARGEANGLDHLGEARGHLGPRGQVGEALGEDFARTVQRLAEELAHPPEEAYLTTCTGQIGGAAPIMAMNAGGWLSAHRTAGTA
jgi:hypothetical protein